MPKTEDEDIYEDIDDDSNDNLENGPIDTRALRENYQNELVYLHSFLYPENGAMISAPMIEDIELERVIHNGIVLHADYPYSSGLTIPAGTKIEGVFDLCDAYDATINFEERALVTAKLNILIDTIAGLWNAHRAEVERRQIDLASGGTGSRTDGTLVIPHHDTLQ